MGTPKITTATSTTTRTTTTTQDLEIEFSKAISFYHNVLATTKPATEEEKISSPDTNISDRTPEEVSKRSSDVGSVKTEETDTTVKKLEKTTTSSVIEVPKEEPSKTNVEVEPEGWGSGASRNLDFVSALLLGSLILTLSNLL